MALESGARKMLLYKRMQRIPLRSTLNIALYDMRKLEYDIRRSVVTPDRMASTNLLKDHYVEDLMQEKRSEVFNENVPKQYRRRATRSHWKLSDSIEPELPYNHPVRRGSKAVDFSPNVDPGSISSRDRKRSVYKGPVSPIPTLRRKSLSPSLDLALKRSSEIISLQLKCRKAKGSVRQERKAVNRTQKRVLERFGRCSEDVNKALRVDVDGVIPKELAEYIEKQSKERSQDRLVATAAVAFPKETNNGLDP